MSLIILIAVSAIMIYIMFSMFSSKRLKKINVESSNNIINLDEKNFQQSTKGRIALVDFWAEWCMPCKMMTPVLNEVANEVSENVKVCKVNVDNQKSLTTKFSVQSIPTLVLLKNGKEIDRFVGVKPKGFLLEKISKANN
jgi:thioredoxin 1